MYLVKRISILILSMAPCVVGGCLLGVYLQGVVLAVIGGFIGAVLGLAVILFAESRNGRNPIDFGVMVVAVAFGAGAGICFLIMGIAAVVKALI